MDDMNNLRVNVEGGYCDDRIGSCLWIEVVRDSFS